MNCYLIVGASILAVSMMAFWLYLALLQARWKRDALDREAQQWAKLYWDLRDDTPARGEDGRFTRRGK